MKIGIDISQSVYEGTGVGNYTKNLVENLLAIDKSNEYVLFGSSLRRRQKGFWPFPPTLLDLFWNQWHVLPIEKLIGKIDVFHTSDWTQPPAQAKKVTTVFDLVVYKYPETSHQKIIETQKRALEWAKKECRAFIAISNSTKKDMVEILKIPEEKIKVIYLAAGKDYLNYDGKKKYQSKKPYILTVGTIEPRKNLNRLAAAFDLLNLKDYDLVIAGKSGWGDQIKGLGYVPQEDMPSLYAGASLFVYPSLYEGFGVPILEAMTVGCPVATSNISSMPEVGGDAAVYFDPMSVEDIAEKMKWALEHTKSLKDKSLMQAKNFSWEKTARETIEVYEELA